MSLSNTLPVRWSLSKLLAGIACVSPKQEVVVEGISQMHDKVRKGDLFLALAGRTTHGLQFGEQVAAAGAAAIGWEPVEDCTQLPFPEDLPCVRIDQLSNRVGVLTSRFYGDPSARLKVIAVTGTDGKSSVSHFVAQALQYLNRRCGVIGTLGVGIPGHLSQNPHTTPPPTVLQESFYRFLTEDHCEYAAIEASSHGLDQGRLNGTHVDTAILTNITRDHFDYHKDYSSYVNAKARLFFEFNALHLVLNADDETGSRWAHELNSKHRVITYSCSKSDSESGEHLYASDICLTNQGVRFELWFGKQNYPVQLRLFGRFNVSNALAVAAALRAQSIGEKDIVDALSHLQPVEGRMQVLAAAHGPAAIVDYAHTPAALESALNTVKEHFAGVCYCVFGCGGNRDQGKRALMGEIASRLADIVVLTSDNPRNEDPVAIIEDIKSNVSRPVTVCVDRSEAIRYALKTAQPGDVVLVAGKGHERYQEVKGHQLPYSDIETVAAILQEIHTNE